MKIIGVCCSPRKEKTTYYALNSALQAVKEDYPQMETQLLDLAGKRINGCISCGACVKKLECSQDDDFNDLVPMLADEEVKGLIIATPVYLGSMSSQCKAFMDRCVMFRRNGFLFSDRVGGVIAVGGVRNGGQTATIQHIHAVMLVQDMIVVGDGKPGAHFGGTMWSGMSEGIENDSVGLATVESLGKRVAGVVAKLNS